MLALSRYLVFNPSIAWLTAKNSACAQGHFEDSTSFDAMDKTSPESRATAATTGTSFDESFSALLMTSSMISLIYLGKLAGNHVTIQYGTIFFTLCQERQNATVILELTAYIKNTTLFEQKAMDLHFMEKTMNIMKKTLVATLLGGMVIAADVGATSEEKASQASQESLDIKQISLIGENQYETLKQSLPEEDFFRQMTKEALERSPEKKHGKLALRLRGVPEAQGRAVVVLSNQANKEEVQTSLRYSCFDEAYKGYNHDVLNKLSPEELIQLLIFMGQAYNDQQRQAFLATVYSGDFIAKAASAYKLCADAYKQELDSVKKTVAEQVQIAVHDAETKIYKLACANIILEGEIEKLRSNTQDQTLTIRQVVDDQQPQLSEKQIQETIRLVCDKPQLQLEDEQPQQRIQALETELSEMKSHNAALEERIKKVMDVLSGKAE